MTGDRIPVTVLGATGAVGQRFGALLAEHPWFELASVCASGRSVGASYGTTGLLIEPCAPGAGPVTPLVFSALDASVAGPIEEEYARAGACVVTNASPHRMDADVPLLVPEVNPDHLELCSSQGYGDGSIIANPNCSTIGLALALWPLVERFGVEAAHVVTLQARSGAGAAGLADPRVTQNVLPNIPGEEEKLEREPLKIFGTHIDLSAQCNRVDVVDGHTECVSLRLGLDATREELIEAWAGFRGEPQERSLPSAPTQPVIFDADEDAPQPRLHLDRGEGMACVVARLKPCPVLGWKFVLLSHNTLRGAAGGAVLCAELLVARGMVSR